MPVETGVKAIEAPFPHIPMHVVETEGIRSVRADLGVNGLSVVEPGLPGCIALVPVVLSVLVRQIHHALLVSARTHFFFFFFGAFFALPWFCSRKAIPCRM